MEFCQSRRFAAYLILAMSLVGAPAFGADEAPAAESAEAPAKAAPEEEERTYLRVSEPMVGGLVLMGLAGLAHRTRRQRLPAFYDERIVR